MLAVVVGSVAVYACGGDGDDGDSGGDDTGGDDGNDDGGDGGEAGDGGDGADGGDGLPGDTGFPGDDGLPGDDGADAGDSGFPDDAGDSTDDGADDGGDGGGDTLDGQDCTASSECMSGVCAKFNNTDDMGECRSTCASNDDCPLGLCCDGVLAEDVTVSTCINSC